MSQERGRFANRNPSRIIAYGLNGIQPFCLRVDSYSDEVWSCTNETADERRFTQMEPMKVGVYRRASAVPNC